jgi:hypothetical protein
MQLPSRGFELLEHLLVILELELGGPLGLLRRFPTLSARVNPRERISLRAAA